MTLANAGFNQISRYGYKGAATLNRVSKTYSKATKESTVTSSSDISLMAYVEGYPVSDIPDTTFKTVGYMVMVAPDSDFDGVISQNDTVTINSVSCRIYRQEAFYVAGSLAYVEVVCGV